MASAQNTSAPLFLADVGQPGQTPPPTEPRLASHSQRRRPSRDTDVRQQQGRRPSVLSGFPLQASEGVWIAPRRDVVGLGQHRVADRPQDQVVSVHAGNLNDPRSGVTFHRQTILHGSSHD